MCGWAGYWPDSVDVAAKGCHTSCGHLMAQESDVFRQKVTLTKVDGETISIQDAKHFPEHNQIWSHVRGADEDVVQVDEDVGHLRQQVVHQSLKRLCRVFQPEGHVQIFVQAKWDDDHGLWHISISNRGGRIIDNLQIDNLTNFRQIDNRQIDNLTF